MDIQAARAKRSSMPNVPPPPISARMTATGGKHRPEKPLRKLPQLAKSSREDQPCRSLRKLPVNQSHESPSPLHKSIRNFVHAPLYASTDTRRRRTRRRTRNGPHRPATSRWTSASPRTGERPARSNHARPPGPRPTCSTRSDSARTGSQASGRPNSGRSTHGARNRPRGADTAARTAFRRSAHDVRGCERQTRRNGIPRPPRCRRSGHARPSRRTAQWS